MMLEAAGVHPDEGTIHAWLDGALDANASAEVESHIASCATCAPRAAEARGLIAGASRVVGLLDENPAPLLEPASTRTAGTDLSVWRLLRVTPVRASIAAMLVVAVGIMLTRGHLAVDTGSGIPALDTVASSSVRTGVGPAATMSATVPAPPAGNAMIHDSVLNSAVSRRLASEQPLRTLAPTPGVAIPSAPSEGSAAQRNDVNAEAKVLAGRASMVAQRESAGTRADRTRAGVGQLAASAAEATERVTVAAKAADNATRQGFDSRSSAPSAIVGRGECYRIESASPAVWGSVHLPMLLAMDSAGTLARILTASGGETEARASLRRGGPDTAFFVLRRIGFIGAMTLSGSGEARSGTVQSAPANPALSAVVVTGTASRSDSNVVAAGSRAGQARKSGTTPSVEQRSAVAPVGAGVASGPLIAITARRVSCPAP